MIRKILTILAVLSLSVYNIAAQSDKFKPEWNIGVGGGPTFSSLDFQGFYGQGNVSTKNYTQFHGGVAIRYIAERNVGVIAELNYSQQGWKGEYKDQPQFEHSHRLTYLELPVLTHIYFGSNKVRFIANLGPKIQFLLSEKEYINDALANSLVNNEDGLVTLQYNRKAERKFDYGITAGLGMELRTGVGNFMLEGRYYFGLGDIYDNKKNADNFSRSANRVISVKLTYYIKVF